ncbi:MAG TPA: acyltransferase family protein [Steroidobacteraceae bacterium]|nr:acyltransferase family protein [Steroidobacteraceae bacterium]
MLRPRMLEAGRQTLAYRPDIDGLRAVAVGLVVLFHAFPGVRSGGFVGVDVFFVISGYLITGIVLGSLDAGKFDLRVFYQRRVRRILPALLIVLAACCAFGWLTLLPSELKWLGSTLSWCASFLANMFFATRSGGYFEPANESNPLLHLWSLGVEEQFYLAWPLLMMLAGRYRVVLPTLLAVVASSFAISLWGAWYDPAKHFYLPTARAWELAVGGLLACVGTSQGRLAWRAAGPVSCAGLVLIGAGGVLWQADEPVPGSWSLLPTAGATLLIWAGPSGFVNRWLLSRRPMIWIGQISYPLYLWHWPIFSFAYIFLGRAPAPLESACAVVVAVAAAAATYRFVELPVRHGRFGGKAAFTLLAGLACFAFLGVALQNEWIPARLSGPLAAKWDDAVTDWHYPGEGEVDPRSGLAMLTVSSHRALKVVFVGDSHIQQYWPRVDRVIRYRPAAARTAVFASHSACPPLPGLEIRRPGHDCSAVFERAIDRACQPDVDTVVFGAFWESYFLGAYAIAHASQPVYSRADPTRSVLQLDSPATRAAFEQFRSVVAELVGHGRRVYILLSNPAAPQFVPLFPWEIRLSLHPPRSLDSSAHRAFDVTPFEEFVAPLTARLRAIGQQTGAKVVDPRTTLCNGNQCPTTYADGMPLYFDAGHIRARTASERATFIDEMLLGPETAAHPACAVSREPSRKAGT